MVLGVTALNSTAIELVDLIVLTEDHQHGHRTGLAGSLLQRLPKAGTYRSRGADELWMMTDELLGHMATRREASHGDLFEVAVVLLRSIFDRQLEKIQVGLCSIELFTREIPRPAQAIGTSLTV